MKGIDERRILAGPVFGILLRHFQAGRFDEARAIGLALVDRYPTHAEALYHLGLLEAYPGHRWDAALAYMRQAAALRPGWPEARYNAGYFAQRLGHFNEAEACYREALALEPALAAALVNLGTLHLGRGELDEATRLFDQAIATHCEEGLARYNRGMASLLMGHWDVGWADYEERLRTPIFRRHAPFPFPLWDGQPMPGKTLLVEADQGLGDTVMCLRWGSALLERFGRVIWRIQEAALSLCPMGWETQSDTEPYPRGVDVAVPLMSLPHRLNARPDTVNGSAYLTPWEPSPNQRYRVGFCWAGSPDHEGDRYRSLPESHAQAALAQWQALPGIEVVSLQYGAGLRSLSLRHTARLMRSLDLVITVDTVIGHLAGAIGCPCWLLLPAHPDYRWMLGSERTPWYDSVRLFRQAKMGEWGTVLERVTTMLTEATA